MRVLNVCMLRRLAASGKCWLVLFLAIAAQTTLAQSQGAPVPPQLREHVEVVATRVPENADDVPFPLDVISGEDLRDRGVTTLRDALTLATGLDVAPGGDNGPASAVPEMWGLKEFDAFLLVVDDIPLGGAFNPALSTLDLHDVERIEILRGAAPVTFGATSFVGVIHVVHRQPGVMPQSLAASVGSFGSGSGSVMLTVPLGRWQSRVAFDAERRGFTDTRTSFRRGHILWSGARVSGGSRTWFSVDGGIVDQNPASPHPRVGTSLTDAVPLDANHNPAGAFINDDRLTALFGTERAIGTNATWATVASASRANHDMLRGFLQDVSNTGVNARGLQQEIDFTDIYVDSHVARGVGKQFQLVLGGDWLHGRGNSTGIDFAYHAPLDGSSATTAVMPSTPPVAMSDLREFVGGYVSAAWNVTGRLRIDGGLRFNVTHEEGEHGNEDERSNASEEGVQNNVRPSGSVGAIWTAWQQGADRVRLFANYRNSFKPAAIDFGLGEAEEGGESPLDPETSHSVDGGVKSRLAGGRVDVTGAVFTMDFANLVIARTINGLPALTNAGTQRFRGFEGSAEWRVRQDVIGRATYSFHDARFRDYVAEFDGVPSQLAGKRLEMSARHLSSAGVIYAPRRGVVATGTMNFVGSRFLNKRNTALAEGYTVLSAGVAYRTERWEVRLDGRNLTDRRPPVTESELGDAQYYRLPARQFDLTFSTRLGS